MTSSAESLLNSIRYHCHYDDCLLHCSSRNSYFSHKCSELSRYINYRKKGYKLKEEIIEENNNLKIKEKESSMAIDIKEKEYENIKNELQRKENNTKEYYDNKLKLLQEEKKNERKNAEYQIENLDKNIGVLKELIEELTKKNIEEED